jgi:hypothetical protein
MIAGQEEQKLEQASSTENEILRVENLVKYFPIQAGLFKRTVRARRSASWGSRVAARRRSAARS